MMKKSIDVIMVIIMLALTACSPSNISPSNPSATSLTPFPPTASPTYIPKSTTATPTFENTPGSDSTLIPRYGIFEKTINWKSESYDNPWEQVTLSMTLTAPSGKEINIDGFYYGPDTWKVRYSPAETGSWSWKAVIMDNSHQDTQTGSFTVVPSDSHGFVRQNPNNKFRWVLDDGSAFFPIGINDCILDMSKDGNPSNGMSNDGSSNNRTMDAYLKAYGSAGFNLFRWSVRNCTFGLVSTISPSGNIYLPETGIWADEIMQKLRQNGFHVYMVIFGDPPFPNGSKNPAQMEAVKRYVKYVVDRYGAYVDFWELMNESPHSPLTIDTGWYQQIGGYLKSIDIYRHPVSTSWERPDLVVIDINSPHWYQTEGDFESDQVTWDMIKDLKSAGKPIIFGEQGNVNINWDKTSALRMRIRSWTAFFAEGTLIFWNTSDCKCYSNIYAANIYLGPEERGYIEVLQDFNKDFDPRAKITTLKVSNPKLVRGYALSGPAGFAVYLHAYTDHTNPTTGISITIAPQFAGTGKWINPATGAIVATEIVSSGSQSLAVPSFVTDIAFKLTTMNGGE